MDRKYIHEWVEYATRTEALDQINSKCFIYKSMGEMESIQSSLSNG